MAEFNQAKVDDPTIRLQAHEHLEYGESRKGYWTSEKFIKQKEMAVKIAEKKSTKNDGWRPI